MKMNNIKLFLCLILSMVMMISVIGISAVASDTPFDEELDVPEMPEVPEDHEHSFTDWQSIPGNISKHVRHCECGKVEHEDCKLDSGVVTTKPTYEAGGVMTYTCKVCGGTKTEKIDKLNPDEPNPYEDDKASDDEKSYAWIIPLVVAMIAASGTVLCGVMIIKKKSAEKNEVEKTDSSDDIKDKVNEE